jgi:phosphatidate cytidylyltransferase
MADTPATPPIALSKGQIFMRRLSSTIVLWAIVLTSIFSSNVFVREYVFLGLMMLLAWTGLHEFYALVEKRGLVCFRGWGIFGGLLLMGATFFYLTAYLRQNPVQSLMPAKANDFETSVLILFVLGLCVRQFLAKNNTAGIQAISTTLFGLMYVPWLLNFIQKITFFPGVDGRYYLL